MSLEGFEIALAIAVGSFAIMVCYVQVLEINDRKKKRRELWYQDSGEEEFDGKDGE